MFKAIHIFRKNNQFPSTLYGLSMIIASLKCIGINKEDTIIIACDKGKSWRKEFDSAYKSNRKEDREKIESEEWWKERFREFDELKNKLTFATPFHILEGNRLEADDIISYGVRYFKDNECIIVSIDSDFEQLAAFSNVKLFSPTSKKYKIVKNPYAILEEKIKKETTDNLTSPITTKEEYLRREKIVNLLTLPEEIELRLKEIFENNIGDKIYDVELLPFNSIRKRFKDIYDVKKTISMIKKIKNKVKNKTKQIQLL